MSTKVAVVNAGTTLAPALSNSQTVNQAPRPRARKRVVQIPEALFRTDSAAAMPPPNGPPASHGVKRYAQDKTDDEPRKRKRANNQALPSQSQSSQIPPATSSASSVAQGSKTVGKPEGESQPSLFDFSTLPTSSLYSYAIQYELVPAIYPTPLSADDPPPPAAFLDPSKMASRGPSPVLIPTPANRPRRSRESKEASRRRSTRLLEEEARAELEQAPVLNDVREIHGILANLAMRHFRETNVREVDTLAAFMCAVKARTGRWR